MGQSPVCQTCTPTDDSLIGLVGASFVGSDLLKEPLCGCFPDPVPCYLETLRRGCDPEPSRGSRVTSVVREEPGGLLLPHSHARLQDYYASDGCQIGEGSYGTVVRAGVRALDSMGRPGETLVGQVAIKTFSLDAVPSDPVRHRSGLTSPVRSPRGKPLEQTRKKMSASFETERLILSKLEHPHIVKMLEAFVESTSLHIVLELCQGGDLFEYIFRHRAEHRSGLSEGVARHLFWQMLYAINYLHTKRIVHRDIKTENFLLQGSSSIKLCDFGTAIQLSDRMPRSTDKIGTLSYTAPEVYSNLGASLRSDDWSMGVVLYVLLVGASPFRTSSRDSPQETMERICRGSFERARHGWKQSTVAAQDLIQRFLVVRERERLTSAVALRHSWVQEGRGQPHDGELQACAPAAMQACLRFQKLERVSRRFLGICARVLPEAGIIDACGVSWYRLFQAFDRNLDGRLDYSELVQGFRALLGSEVESNDLETMAKNLDAGQEGFVSWTCWLAVVLFASQRLDDQQEPLSTIHRLLSRTSRDGRIYTEDLLNVLGKEANLSEVSKMLSVCGKSGTSLSLADLRRMVREFGASDWNDAPEAPHARSVLIDFGHMPTVAVGM